MDGNQPPLESMDWAAYLFSAVPVIQRQSFLWMSILCVAVKNSDENCADSFRIVSGNREGQWLLQ